MDKAAFKADFRRSRSKSRTEFKSIIKFADFINIDNPEIMPMHQKICGCPSILIVDDQFINRYIINEYSK